MAAESTDLEILAEGQHVRLVRRGTWEYAERTNANMAVVVVAVTEENKLLLVEQERIPVGKPVIELPAGLVGDEPQHADERATDTAKRELIEETGYEAAEITFLAEGPPSAGMTNERVTFFRASGLKKVGPGGGTEDEELDVHEIPLDRVAAWLHEANRRGKLVDPKTYVGLYFLQAQRGK